MIRGSTYTRCRNSCSGSGGRATMATPRDIYSTLNQDLFFERYLFNEHVAGALPGALPGLVPVPGQRWFRSNVEPYSPSFMMQPVADPRTQGQLQHHINVIKLHGSVNWRSPGGRNVMVIGTTRRTPVDRSMQ